MTKEELKQYIDENVYENPDGDITGEDLNVVLKKMVDVASVGPAGPANALSIGDVEEGQTAAASITGTPPNQVLNLILPKGDKGDPGSNPFKGWFTTDNIPTIGQEGDYCNVSDTSVTPPTVTIYRWDDTQESFVDTGEVPDTATGETFASGETLQQVAIDDSHLANPVNTADATQPVLAQAEDVMHLKAKLEGIDLTETKVPLVASGVGQNYYSGFYVDASAEAIRSTSAGNPPNGVIVVDCRRFKKVRFLGMGVSNASSFGWGFSATLPTVADNTPLTNCKSWSMVGSNQQWEYVVDVPEETPYLVLTVRVYNNQIMTIDEFYCYLQNGDTVMDLIDDVKKTLYDYKPLTFEDLGMGAIPDSPTDNTPITSQVETSSSYRIYQFDITGRNTLKCEGIVGDHNLTRYIYFFADSNNVFISKDPLKGERYLSWSDYMLSVPHGAKYLYVNVVSPERSYYQVEGLEEKNFVTEDEIEGLPERISAVEEEVDDITTVLSKVGDIISDFTITDWTRLEHQEVGKTISQCEHSSTTLSYRKYEIVPGKTYNYNATYGKINDYIIPVVWTDENEVIIKVEPFRCDVSRISTFENERIVAPQGAKYLFMNVTGKYKSVTSLAEVVAVYSETLAEKKTIRLLSVGNSYSQDALAYVPFIIKNMGVDANIDIAILMQSGASLDDHVSNFDNETAAYEFWRNTGNGAWTKRTGDVTIQWALENYKWDLILLQQASSPAYYSYENYYQPYLNKLINSIAAFVQYPIKFGWYAVQSKARASNGSTPWLEETINSHWQSIMENAKSVMDETVCEFLVPVSTAIQNARTVPSIKAIGSYASNGGNGVGYLENSDGVHLQEGLPCQIAAYVFVIALLDLYGFQYSINGESTIVDSDWETGKNIPAPHGSPVGSDETNILIAQKCAIMAVKFPYVTTDMNYIIYPS